MLTEVGELIEVIQQLDEQTLQGDFELWQKNADTVTNFEQ